MISNREMIEEIKKWLRENGFEYTGKTTEGWAIFENTVKKGEIQSKRK